MGKPNDPPTAIKFNAAPKTNLYVFAGQSGYLTKIGKDGDVAWQLNIGFSVSEGRFRYVDGDSVVFIARSEELHIDVQTGVVLAKSKIPNTTFKNEVGKITYSQNSKFVWNDGDVSEETYTWPRVFDTYDDFLAVSDTFGHRVVIYKNREKVKEVEVYYPSGAFFVDADTLIVTAEHSNQIFEYTISADTYKIIYSCQANDIFTKLHSLGEIRSMERSGALTDDSGLGVCAKELAGVNTVYSPNSARRTPDGNVVIADTDNHRVIEIDSDGNILREVSLFNQPIDVISSEY